MFIVCTRRSNLDHNALRARPSDFSENEATLFEHDPPLYLGSAVAITMERRILSALFPPRPLSPGVIPGRRSL